MAEVMSSLEPGNEDFSTGGGQDQLGASSVKVGLSVPLQQRKFTMVHHSTVTHVHYGASLYNNTCSLWCITLQQRMFTMVHHSTATHVHYGASLYTTATHVHYGASLYSNASSLWRFTLQ